MKRPDVRWTTRRGPRGASPHAPRRMAAAGASIGRVSPLKKVLMTFMILGTMGTTLGAGTFASFNASTSTQASTFETGTLVLTDKAPTGATCFSSSGTDTSDNDNEACTAMFTSTNASIKRPGDIATAELTLGNEGSLSGTLTSYMTTAANCQDGDVVGANFKGSGVSTCQNVQLAIQEYTNSGRGTTSVCRYGSGATGVVNGTAVTLPLNITAANQRFRLQVNGATFATDALIAIANYTTIDSLAAAVQTAARAVTGGAGVIVAGTTNNTLQVSNPTPLSGTNNVAMVAPIGGSSALAGLGLSSLTVQTGGQQTCGLAPTTPDHTHTLGTFLAAYPTALAGLPMSTLTPSQSRWYVLTLMLPPGVDNQLQGRKVTFSMSWTLTQL